MNFHGRRRTGISRGFSSYIGGTLKQGTMGLTSPRGGLGPLISTSVSACDLPKASSTQGKALRAEENQRSTPHNVEQVRRANPSGEEGIERRVYPRVPQATHIGGKHERQSVVEEEFEEGEDHNEDDGVSDDEEGGVATHTERSGGLLVRFPTHEEYIE